MTDRWLRLRHADGFSDEMFDRFRSGCAVWNAYVQASIREQERLEGNAGRVRYECLVPELSPDRCVASLPITGAQTLGSRVKFENVASYLLREFIPFEFAQGLEEGLTEDIGDGRGYQTYWRQPSEALKRAVARAMPFNPSEES